ncbi:XK-related protein 5 [Sorex araneus]|uniref:XK-related protein 5 n=1 Tax=Sorex araneus TaxID=42254 RepID=UPI002433D941|nr:XK-related protein 5 [Sorex araneus]
MQAAVLGVWALLLAAEQSARLCSPIYYFATGRCLWGWLGLGLQLPGLLVQGLSYLWFREDRDGRGGCGLLLLLHLLQLGVWKRHWDAAWTLLCGGCGGPSQLPPLQGAALGTLRLLEALLQATPHLLLQTYILLSPGPGAVVPGVSALCAWLSLSWTLACYTQCLGAMRRGGPPAPWAALLCQLLWRMGMLAARTLSLVLFCRTYRLWVLVITGAHWLGVTFWLVAQQSDVVHSTCHWRLFNLLVGAVGVFCYLNFWGGPSGRRVAAFYTVMSLENVALLLLATNLLQWPPSGSLWPAVSALLGTLIGGVALGLYYSWLHPESTAIRSRFLRSLCGRAGGDSADGGPSRGGLGANVKDSHEPASVQKPLPASGCPHGWAGSQVSGVPSAPQHHWLLVKLALKTGNPARLGAVLGGHPAGGCCPATWHKSHLSPTKRMPLSSQRAPPSSPPEDLVAERAAGSPPEASSYISFVSNDRHKGSTSSLEDSPCGGKGGPTLYFSATAGGTTPDGTVAGGTMADGTTAKETTASGTTAGGITTGRTTADGTTAGKTTAGGTTADGTMADGTTTNGTTAGGTTADGTMADGTTTNGTTAGGTITDDAMAKRTKAHGATPSPRDGQLMKQTPPSRKRLGDGGQAQPAPHSFPVAMASISPIRCPASSLCHGSCRAHSEQGAQPGEPAGHLSPPRAWPGVSLRPADQPCLTSTPKPECPPRVHSQTEGQTAQADAV